MIYSPCLHLPIPIFSRQTRCIFNQFLAHNFYPISTTSYNSSSQQGTIDTSIGNKFIGSVQKRTVNADNKVSIIGAGKTGAACAFSFLAQGITNDICLIDINDDLLKGEYYDLLHASASIKDLKIVATKDYEATANSKVTLFCAGAPGIPSDRLKLLGSSSAILKKALPEIIKYSPNTILYITTNPCDVITYIAWKLSGLPKYRVLGSGTELDSCRLRAHIARRIGVNVSNCRAWMLGEHGDSMVPMWSTVSIAGVRLLDVNAKAGSTEDPDKWQDIGTEVKKIGWNVCNWKGNTAWSICAVASRVMRSILCNTNEIFAASVNAKGFYGIKEDVYLSLPVALGSNGVTDVINLRLTNSEMKSLQSSASMLIKLQHDLKL